MLEVGATEEHVEEFLATSGPLPFTLAEFAAEKQAWLKDARAKEAAAEQERANRRRALDQSPIDVVAGGAPAVSSLEDWRGPMLSPARSNSGAYESQLAEVLGARPVGIGGNARIDAGTKKSRGRTPGSGTKAPRGPAKGRGRPRLSPGGGGTGGGFAGGGSDEALWGTGGDE